MWSSLGLILALVAAGAQQHDERDELEMKSGKTVTGRVLLDVGDRLFLRVGTREYEIEKKALESYRSVYLAQGEMLKRFAEMDPSKETAQALEKLAEFCHKKKLVHDERLFYWRILLVDPDNQNANSRLGHRLRKDKWVIPIRGGVCPFARIDELRSDWGKAWELRSEHYTIKSDAGLKRALETLFELEYFYRFFFTLYQRELEFREVLEPMQIYLYRDSSRFPRVATHVETHFDQDANILHTYVLGQRPVALFHEATHQLLHNLNDRALQGRGDLPAWLVKGWAEYMEGLIIPGAGGRLKLIPGRKLDPHFLLYQRERKPYGLHRVLNFSYEDYKASKDQGLKYAQSYVLFHYLMHAQGCSFRPTFFKYLRAAFRGKGQASTFGNLFEMDKIERDLINYR